MTTRLAGLALLALIWTAPGHQARPEQAPDFFARALEDARAGRFGAAAAAFHPLALAGDGAAAHNLAVLYATGRGTTQDDPEAAYWAIMAELAGSDHSIPLRRLLVARLNEAARDRVAARAVAGLMPRAEAGDGAAMLQIAAILLNIPAQPDPVAAHGWHVIAAALDTPEAVRLRQASLARIAPDKRDEADRAARRQFSDWCAGRGADAPATCALIPKDDASGPEQRS